MSTNELSVEITQEKDTAVNQFLDNLPTDTYKQDKSSKKKSSSPQYEN